MNTFSEIRTHVFQVVRCCTCDCLYGMTNEMRADREKSGDSFYCPNGHSQAYIQSTEQKLRDELQRERQKLDQEKARTVELCGKIQQRDRQISAKRGQITRLKNRAAAGICPCCDRFFAELASHMHTEHPGFRAESQDGEGSEVK